MRFFPTTHFVTLAFLLVGLFSVSSFGQTEEAKEPKTGGALEDALSKAEIHIKA